MEPDLHDDLITEATAISEFVFGTPDEARRIYHLASKGELPIFRMNGKLCARKSSLRAAIKEKEQRALAPTAKQQRAA